MTRFHVDGRVEMVRTVMENERNKIGEKGMKITNSFFLETKIWFV